jgi:hypothetical protein
MTGSAGKVSFEKFYSLFQGNQRNHGRLTPDGSKFSEGAATEELFKKHLDGDDSIGIVPVRDDGTCGFAAIDIDYHGEGEADFEKLEAIINKHNLPLVMCRSKRGGAHLYIFLKEPVQCQRIRALLARWATILGHQGCEVYPKQNRLEGLGRHRSKGNYINLPYQNGHADLSDQLRYCIHEGQPVTLDKFIEIAESRMMTAEGLTALGDKSHAEAPPCIQRIMQEGVTEGVRNEVLYNLAVYFRRRGSEEWRDEAFECMEDIFERPLPYREAKRTIDSAARKDCSYRCREEPLKSMCDSKVCIRRKHGITSTEKSELEYDDLPKFGPIQKILTDPVRWVLYVDDKPVTFATEEIMSFKKVRLTVTEVFTRIIPLMKDQDWQGILAGLMREAQVIEAPEDTTISGMIKEKVEDMMNNYALSKADSQDNVISGAPVVVKVDDIECVAIKGSALQDYLRRAQIREASGANLWVHLRNMGALKHRIIVNGHRVRCYAFPISGLDIVIPDEIAETQGESFNNDY